MLKMHLTFKIKDAEMFEGQSLYLVGNKPQLGNWTVSYYIFLYNNYLDCQCSTDENKWGVLPFVENGKKDFY